MQTWMWSGAAAALVLRSRSAVQRVDGDPRSAGVLPSAGVSVTCSLTASSPSAPFAPALRAVGAVSCAPLVRRTVCSGGGSDSIRVSVLAALAPPHGGVGRGGRGAEALARLRYVLLDVDEL